MSEPVDDHDELDCGQIDSLVTSLGEQLASYRLDLEKANRTIVNLLRNEPLVYMEAAQAAIVQDLQGSRAVWEQENFRYKDKISAIRQVCEKAQQGQYIGLDELLANIWPIVKGGS